MVVILCISEMCFKTFVTLMLTRESQNGVIGRNLKDLVPIHPPAMGTGLLNKLKCLNRESKSIMVFSNVW